ncbi:MAG: biotin--[acetyl-CoA-carboxylase] ligase [Pseudomonadota bacterium]
MSTDFLWDRPATAAGWPVGYDRILLDETDSTMAEARRRAPELAGPTWIFAKRQTQPHGRRGRAWAHPDGNFAATLFLRPGGTAEQAALRSFTAAVALFYTLGMTTGQKGLTLKWPNDVLLNGGKVAGILLESSARAGGVDWLAIGIGINLVEAPPTDAVEPGAVPPVSVKGVVGKVETAEDTLFWLASHYADHERIFTEFGFDPIRRLWLRHAARLGEVITARTARDSLSGTFETVDEVGQLVLRTAKGQVAIPAADVFF